MSTQPLLSKDIVESAGKIGVAALAIAYALGLVILNAHIGRYGVFTASLLRAEYALTGLLWLALIGLSLSTGYAALRLYRHRHTLFDFIPGFMLLLMMWSLLFGLLTGFRMAALRVAPVVLVLAAAGGVFTWRFGVITARALAAVPNVNRAVSGDTVVLIVSYTILLLLTTWIYAITIYPYIGRAFGGGAPTAAEIVVTEDVKSLFASETCVPGRPCRVDIIFESEAFLLIIPTHHADRVPVRLPTNSIVGMRMLRDAPTLLERLQERLRRR